MPAVVVRVVEAAAGGSPTPHDGRWVMAWNPHTEAGTLELTSTDNPDDAYRFTNMSEALRQWQTVSEVEPFRPWDGLLNRPLTGINVVLEPVEP